MTRSNNSSSVNEARRNLLKLGTCGAMTNATFLSSLMHLKMTSAVMADAEIPITGSYKALVCLFFNGAIDSFNVLTPYGTSENDAQYQGYATNRGGAAMKRTAAWDTAWSGTDSGYLNPIDDTATGRRFGLHPRFTFLKQIYEAGHATFMANTGALVEPILNNTQFLQTTNAKVKPIGLYSHPDQQRHWQTAVPTSRTQVKGWAGKMADLITDPSLSQSQSNVYTCVSSAGQSLLLTGNRIGAYSIGPVTNLDLNNTGLPNGGATLLGGFNATGTPGNAYDRIYSNVQKDFASHTYADLLERTLNSGRINSRDAAAFFQQQFPNVTMPTTTNGTTPVVPFPLAGVGSQLGAVARTIKMCSTATSAPLQQNRQIFLVQLGGWDHHANLLANQDTMVAAVDTALKAFYDFLTAEGLLSQVTLFSISDFARTLTFNGSGSDHAWGGNPLVMGGAVLGNRIYGTYPNFPVSSAGSGLDRGRGVLIPQTSTDVYHGHLCRWFGIPQNRLVDVLPNINKFDFTNATKFLDYS